ncbi:hypothetical protein JRQ81_018284 [Phrynocephalus forsythii]|uniref:Uncharacterized protein n=1 Tax=Phrynocephalus forsythii TaxID=171643 RepID=A0A9Q0XSI4_9SAUR|nr:hypothetical protein JRQ81_018284 [Phrynocephalus forsythii]
MDAEQCPLSKSKSRRLTARRRSNSLGLCILPSIPEYPGFQDIKRNYSRGHNFALQDLGRKRSENPRLVDQNRNLGCSANHFTIRQCKTKSSFCDKPLQEYYNEKLMELRNYETNKAKGKTKDYVDENQSPKPFKQGLRRRSSCSALIQANCLNLTEDPSDAADPVQESMTMGTDYRGTDHNSCKKTYLESLAMSINAPLQMLVHLK